MAQQKSLITITLMAHRSQRNRVKEKINKKFNLKKEDRKNWIRKKL